MEGVMEMTKIELITAINKSAFDKDTFYHLTATARIFKVTFQTTTTSGSQRIVEGVALESYGRIVAFYSFTGAALFVFDYWSQTTSSHVSKFIRFIKNTNPNRGCAIIYLYKRSDNVRLIYSTGGRVKWNDPVNGKRFYKSHNRAFRVAQKFGFQYEIDYFIS